MMARRERNGGERAVRRRWPAFLAAAFVLVSLVAAIYHPVVRYDFVGWDDSDYVEQNLDLWSGTTQDVVLRSFASTRGEFWIPLVWLSYLVDARLSGMGPGGFHRTNLFLHAANAVLLFAVLLKMTAAPWCSLLASALFAAHPLNVESVAWVTERKDVLSALFLLLTVGQYVRYSRRPTLSRYLPVVLFFACGLMSKPMLVSLPLGLLVLDYWPLGRLTAARRATVVLPGPGLAARRLPLLEKLPLAAVSLLFGVVTLIIQMKSQSMPPLASISLPGRLANAIVSYPAYLRTAIWPMELSPVYYLFPEGGYPWWQVGGSALLMAALLLLCVRFRRTHPQSLSGFLWYLVMLLPAIGFLQSGFQARADRFTYVPLWGLHLFIAWSAAGWSRGSRPRQLISTAALAGVVVIFGIVSSRQLPWWRNRETLSLRQVELNPRDWLAVDNLGMAFWERGKIDEAEAKFLEAIRQNPRFARAHSNLGLVLEKKKRSDAALAQLRQAVSLEPGDWQWRNNLGAALWRMGRNDAAEAELREAIRLNPGGAPAHVNLGLVLEKKERHDEALAQLREAVALGPWDSVGHNNLGMTLWRRGMIDEAEAKFREAIRLNPSLAPAHFNLGLVLGKAEKYDEALTHFRAAATLDPGDEEARARIGAILERQRPEPGQPVVR